MGYSAENIPDYHNSRLVHMLSLLTRLYSFTTTVEYEKELVLKMYPELQRVDLVKPQRMMHGP
jgi:hypothetical protein